MVRARPTISPLLIGAVLAWCAFSGACFAPPALLPAFDVDIERALQGYPPGTERVELELDSGKRLRGLYVPSDSGAPVVLHLLEATGSVASCKFEYGELCAELSDLGFASLLVDYRGIGISDGHPSVDHLKVDSLAMWQEAVRRAGGDPGRVVVRGVSMGTIATALLLEEGVRPRAIVLISPVLARTVVERFTGVFTGEFLALFTRLLFREVADVDSVEEIREAGTPAFLVIGDEDPLLDEDDRAALSAAVWPAGGGSFRRPGDHLLVSIEAHTLLREERPLYSRFFPDRSPEASRVAQILEALPPEIGEQFAPGSEPHSRLTDLARHCRVGDPILLAAAAIGNANGESAARMVWLHRPDYRPELPFEDLACQLSLEDPAGDLAIDLVEDYSRPIELPRRHGGMYAILDAKAVVRAMHSNGMGLAGGSWSSSVIAAGQRVEVRSDSELLMVSLRARGLAEDDARRQFVRILMKAQRIPDRLTRTGDGALVLEARENGEWRTLDLVTPPPDEPLSLRVRGTLPP